ncbi:MAG: hypothetical protein PHP35_02220 [Candidatus Colwellbacteria bacterium]|nr:hypothetical protein [Candidatus Colwellbacteria bacterium]
MPYLYDGYKGRVGLFEVIDVDDEFKTMIHEEISEVEVLKLIRQKGFITLQQDGILKTIAGLTDLAEVERITGPIEW